MHWSTNYDASQMMLELWGRTSSQQEFTRMWFQPLSNQRQGAEDFEGGNLTDASFFFRVAVIPEPSSATCLAGLFGFGVVLLRRRWMR